MTEPAVAVNGVTKVFPVPFQRRSVVAVRDLNLEVAAGQIYGLLGPNGSGKSTTLKIILGLVPPTTGTARIFGRDSESVASREAVGFLPESPYFYKYLTGEETLRFYGKLCGLRGAALKSRVEELLALVGLTNAGEAAARRLFQGHAATDRSGSGADPGTGAGCPRRTDGGRRSRRRARNSRSDPRPEAARHNRAAFVASARAGAGDLRSRRHSRQRRARPRRRSRRSARNRKSNGARSGKCVAGNDRRVQSLRRATRRATDRSRAAQGFIGTRFS